MAPRDLAEDEMEIIRYGYLSLTVVTERPLSGSGLIHLGLAFDCSLGHRAQNL